MFIRWRQSDQLCCYTCGKGLFNAGCIFSFWTGHPRLVVEGWLVSLACDVRSAGWLAINSLVYLLQTRTIRSGIYIGYDNYRFPGSYYARNPSDSKLYLVRSVSLNKNGCLEWWKLLGVLRTYLPISAARAVQVVSLNAFRPSAIRA